MTETTTVHDFGPGHRCWGHNYEIMNVIDGGQRLRLAVWSSTRPRVGDHMLLSNKDHSTRYQITNVDYPPHMDPDDMYFVDASFDPRA